MIDKTGMKGNNNQTGFDDEFDEDLSKLTEDFELDDDSMNLHNDARSRGSEDLDLDDDDLLGMENDSELIEDDYDSGAQQTAASSPSFLKNYGLLVVILLGVGYYGFKYTSGMFFGGNSAKTAPVQKPQQAASADKSKKPTQTMDQDSSSKKVNPANPDAPAIAMPEAPVMPDPDAPVLPGAPAAPAMPEAPVENNPTMPEQQKPGEPLGNMPDSNSNKDMKLDTNGVATLSSGAKVAVDQAGNAIEPGDTEVAALSTKIEELMASVKAVNTQIDSKSTQNTTQVEGVKKLLGQINANLKEVTEYVQSAGKAINLLSKQVKQQESVLSSIVDSSVTEQLGLNTNLSNVMKSGGLTISAIISGQAWIKDPSGATILVNLGDNIPGYGKVIDIDPIQATVTTDNGKVIK